MEYSEERLKDVIEEMKPLFYEHYLEIAEHTDKIKLNIDYKKYFEMERLGILHTVVTRDKGIIAGYCFTLIMPHLHYKDCLMALNDIIFIRKPFRKGFNAIKLIKFVEKCLQKRGVVKSHISLKIAHDFGILLERIGYIPIEKIYEKMFIENLEVI